MPAAHTDDLFRDTFRIPKRKAQVPAARARVRGVLEKWGFNCIASDVELVACELVTNAVVHCRVPLAEIQVAVHLDGGAVVLEISDPDGERLPLVRMACSPDEVEGGRGLLLVAALSDSWGCRKLEYGKCVWARFAVAGDRPGGLA
ncbi:ATP-binding protein [Streptomyces sp. NRRL F-5135]|uniref:ATP-binding protein n=1 Tax=Streptomyces sp. NRRL F-5135 TaxID=1463858 RepID=UPI0004CBFBB3|nr:ATP-binding protein [Streptomyces sp. NRRL F-5135]